MSDHCKSCLMLKEVRARKVEEIRFLDCEETPAYCRACYQRELAENKRLREALEKIRDEEKTDREMFADLLRRDGEAYKEAMEHISKSETIAEEALK